MAEMAGRLAMPRLDFPYRGLEESGRNYPKIPMVLFNPEDSAKQTRILGLVDTGADITMLDSALMLPLGMETDQPADAPLGGINTEAPIKGWERTLIIGLGTDTSPELFHPNGLDPVPVIFVEKPNPQLIGRTNFLDRCQLTFNSWVGRLTLEF
ncbi:MAG TPA: hypothetical protein VFS19_04735 [Planctomycetota bacterium]|nr:hypothetical protein [Planctomycetota bacterium]